MDLISRKTAKDYIDSQKGRPFICCTIGEAMKIMLDEVPSVEIVSKWIPVTEALPEEREWLGTKRFRTTISDEVYVTFENPKGERFCKHLSFQNGKLSRFDQSAIDAFYPEAKPIAWMPLPEPWRGDQ